MTLIYRDAKHHSAPHYTMGIKAFNNNGFITNIYFIMCPVDPQAYLIELSLVPEHTIESGILSFNKNSQIVVFYYNTVQRDLNHLETAKHHLGPLY